MGKVQHQDIRDKPVDLQSLFAVFSYHGDEFFFSSSFTVWNFDDSERREETYVLQEIRIYFYSRVDGRIVCGCEEKSVIGEMLGYSYVLRQQREWFLVEREVNIDDEKGFDD